MFCHLWVHKQQHWPYLGIVDRRLIDHPGLLTEKRARMKILLFDPQKTIPVKQLQALLKQMIALRS